MNVDRTDELVGTGPASSAHKPFGPVAAVFLASGIGAVVLGLLTTLAEANETIKTKLELTTPVGPLSGKTVLASFGFFASWVILALIFRGKDPEPKKIFIWTGVMVGIGLLLTFPIFFQSFAPAE